MSESRAKKSTTWLKHWYNSPYGRVFVLLGGILLVLALVGIVNLAVFAFGGNEKRLAEAIATSLQQPRVNGTVSVVQQNQQSSSIGLQGKFAFENRQHLSFDGKLVGSYQNQSVEVPIKAYSNVPQSTTYVRISDAQKVADMFGADLAAIRPDLDAIATKINDKWVRIKQGDNQAATCTTQLIDTVSRNKDASQELAKVYLSHRFVTVSSRQDISDTKQVYTVNFDRSALSGFMDGIKQTDFFKSTKGCNASYDPLGTEAASQQQAGASGTSSATESKITVENGKVTKFVSVNTNSGKVDATNVTFDYTGGNPLSAPTTDIIDMSELQTELQSIGKVLQSAAAASQSAQ